MIRKLSMLALMFSLVTQTNVNATDENSGLGEISQPSSKKAKLEKKVEQKEVAKPEVSIDLCPLSRKDVVVELNLSNNKYLTDINFLLGFPTLTSLDLTNCWNLKDNYYPVSLLKNLRILNISNIGLTTTEPLKRITSLTSLEIFVPKNCMQHIVQLPALKELRLFLGYHGDPGDSELDQLSELKSLEKLNLCGMFNNPEITNYICPSLNFLSSLIGLKTLDLSCNNYLTSLKPILNLSNLTDLNLASSKSIYDLTEVSKLKSLVNLNLDYIDYTSRRTIKKDLESLKELKNLRNLIISPLALEDVPDLPKEVIIHKRKGNFIHPTLHISDT